MNREVVMYTIFPWTRGGKDKRAQILSKNGIFELDDHRNTFTVEGLIYSYGKKLPISDVMSILLYQHPYVQRNFVSNPVFHLEGPYEDGNVTLKENDIVIDAGANIGIFSLFASKKVGSGGVVYSFEPITEAAELLTKNIAANKLSNVVWAPYALSDRRQRISISLDEGLLGNSAILNKSEKIEEVEGITLDEYVEENDIKRVDFIKADIEGAERYFLQGAKQTITKHRPRIAICTYHLPDDPEVIENLLRSYVPEYTFLKTDTKLFASV